MLNEPSLARQFRQCHSQLDEIFTLHQEALLQCKLENALVILTCYQACHGQHMDFEDEVLLTKYASLRKPGRWNADLYGLEHRKIEDLYNKIENGLRWLIDEKLDASQLRRNIIKLLDREKSFKGLCEHHQEREEESLFIELDAQTDAHWRTEVINKFRKQWEEVTRKEMQVIESLNGKVA